MSQYTVINITHQSKCQIVCMSSTHWHFLWQRPQQIMLRLSRDYNVLYVDPPYPVPLKEIHNTATYQKVNIQNRLKSVNNSLKVLTPYKIADCAGEAVENFKIENTWFIKNQVQKALTSLRWYQPLLWIYDLPSVSLIEKLDERGVLYDCVDSFSSFSWADPKTQSWEDDLLNKANVVLTSADTLYKERSTRNRNTYFVPNAADYDHFSKCGSFENVTPAELKNIKSPQLAFIGAVYEWLDFSLIEKIAVNNPDWNLIMVGPKQHDLKIPECNNIHWLGARDYKSLPLYMQSFDLMLIPFLQNEVTKHANPIKLWEYLAAGKAVISTDLPEVPELPEVIWLSDAHESFIENCSKALDLLKIPEKKLKLAQKARTLAKNNSWDERCKVIRMILKKHFNM